MRLGHKVGTVGGLGRGGYGSNNPNLLAEMMMWFDYYKTENGSDKPFLLYICLSLSLSIN
jgi:hypothetical protein